MRFFFLANPQALQSLTCHDWLGLIHPVLMILFVYPVVGATIRLGILAREKRLNINPIADTVPVEHAQHGAWVTGGVLVAVLIGLCHSLWSSHPLALIVTGSAVLFGFGRLLTTRMVWQRFLWASASASRPASAGAATSRGAIQRCSLEPPVLAVAFLDGDVAHRPVAELNGATALDWSFRAGQAHPHQQQSDGGFAAGHASDFGNAKSAAALSQR